MRKILALSVAFVLLFACQKEELEIIDMSVNINDISRIELRADNNTLIRNGEAKMKFYPVAYQTKRVPKYTVIDGKYVTDTVEVEYIIQKDLIVGGEIKVQTADGVDVANNEYSTTTAAAGSEIEFYATNGTVKSNRLKIKIREIADESYPELVVPIIFHMIIPPASEGQNYEITVEHLQKVIDRVNDIFNKRVTTDPVGGNVKLRFELAKYNANGTPLTQPGMNVRNLTATNIEEIKLYSSSTSNLSTGYDRFFVKNKSTYIWDPNKYLNVWVTKFSSSTSELGTYSYKYLEPKYIHSSYPTNSIPGLTGMISQDSFTLNDLVFNAATPSSSTSCLQVGVIVNYATLINPMVQGSNAFNFATVLGYYYGLLNTRTGSNSYPSTDPDYCLDTPIYYYSSSSNASFYKDNSSYSNRPESVPLQYFTSYNVIDIYTFGNSVTVDQANRMRSVLEKCPTRWTYKSSFALTGK